MQTWKEYLNSHQDRFVEELKDFLRIPSISSLSEHKQDVKDAGDWLAGRMTTAGIENVRVMPTEGHPVVYGDWLHAGDRPTILIYGHFDVQPVDPIDLWRQPPFEPIVDQDRIYGRGASDDKGNLLIPVLATEAWLKTEGTLPLNLKFLFEGQEEIGSPQLADFLETHKSLLDSDMVYSADGGQWTEDQPALLMGLRGLCAVQIDVKGPDSDLHSGTYGGSIMNPIYALSRILSSLHDAEGKIIVPGFYDEVADISENESARLKAVPFDESEYCRKIGVQGLFGEPGYHTYERCWTRPTLEFNGIWGGFQEEGIKTVLPSTAHAKISCRLVPDQKPEKIQEILAEYISSLTPPQVTVSVDAVPDYADPYRIPMDHPGNKAAREVHMRLYNKEPYAIWMGGSIPFCGMIKKILGIYTINFAFGLKDELVHAPNEFFRISSFRKGQIAYGMLFGDLGR